jgi:6-phosphogluconolactonase
MEIHIFNSLQDLNESFTEWFKEINSSEKQITVALSGGTTPKSLFDYWSSLPQDEINWTKIKFFWGDERCVSPEDSESNFKMTKEHLFNNIKIPEENIFRIKGENNSTEEAMRYGELLNSELEQQNGTPVFDIVILGMGDDGHTASIFPHEIELWDNKNNCVTSTHPISGQIRVSITGKIINAAKNVVFLVTGKNKAEKVKEIIELPEVAEKKYPAALVQPDSENLYWYLDEAAAEMIMGFTV